MTLSRIVLEAAPDLYAPRSRTIMLEKPRSWFSKLVSIRGSVLGQTWGRVTACTLLSILVTAGELNYHLETYTLTTTPFLLMGVVISILLGFLIRAAHDRWWEGRILWGRLVNVSRTFARQAMVFLDAEATIDREDDGTDGLFDDLVIRTIAYVHAVRHHLRKSDPTVDLRRLLPAADAAAAADRGNVPIALLEGTATRLRDAYREGRLSDYRFVAMEASLLEMTSIQGGCERIRNTPLPLSYTVLIHRLVAFYCFTLPFGIVESVRWFTPLVVLLIAHTFYGLDALVDEIEEPFGLDPNDLPLDALCNTIEANLRQTTGELQPEFRNAEHNGVLT